MSGRRARAIEPIYPIIGERMRVLRNLRGESQDEVAKVLGTTRAHVCNMENGLQRIPVHRVLAFAAHVGVDIGAFLSAEGRGRSRR